MPERIVVLDGYTLNPGDIDWSPVAQHGDLVVHDRTAPDELLNRAAGASCLLLNKTPLDDAAMAKLPDLRYVGVLATGYNVVNVAAAASRGIVVTNIPTYGTDSVAQHVTALMLEFCRGTAVHDSAVHSGQWSVNEDWCFALTPIFELSGKTLGIVGIGRIGRAVARIGAAMGMRVIACDNHWPEAELADLSVSQVGLQELFESADVVSLHCPLTPETDKLVNEERLGVMKPNALLINTSRGPLIDNDALAKALRAGVIAGAALDVLDVEPPSAAHPLLEAPNCIVTPHIAWYAKEARARLMQIAADNLRAYLRGRPANVVT